MEVLRCTLWPELAEEEEGPVEEEVVAAECLVVPLVMVPGRARARLRLLADRDTPPPLSSFLRPSSRYVAVTSLYF